MDEIFTGIAVGIGEYFIERDARRNEQLVKNNWRDKKGKLRGPYNSYGRLLLSINRHVAARCVCIIWWCATLVCKAS